MRSVIFALMLGAVASATACDKEKGPEGAASTPSATAALGSAAPITAATVDPVASAAAPAADNIPVAADFEEEAEKTITKANYRTELDSIEAELK